MQLRAIVLFGALLAAPAWAQQAAPKAFDLNSDSVQQIVRATAATQFRSIEPVKEPKAAREPLFALTEVQAIEAPTLTPPPAPRPVRPQRQGPISALIEVLLGLEPDIEAEARANYLQICQQPDRPTAQRYITCPGMSSQSN
jgi:hypothetical protein